MPRGKNYANNQRGIQGKPGGNGGPNSVYRHDEPQRSSGGKNDVCIPFLAGKCTFENGCRKRHPSKEDMPRLLARYKKTRCRFKDECYTEGCLFLHPKEEKQQEPSFIAPHHFPPLSNVCTSAPSTSMGPNLKQPTVTDSAWKKNPAMAVDAPPSVESSIISASPGQSNEQQIKNSSPTLEPQPLAPNHPPSAWIYPNGAGGEPPRMMNSPPQQQPVPTINPPQQVYYQDSSPAAAVMVPNMVPPMIDLNTGYPIDPSVYYYYEQQAYFYHQNEQQHPMAPHPIMTGNGMLGPSMAIPFNAEAQEFVPGVFTA